MGVAYDIKFLIVRKGLETGLLAVVQSVSSGRLIFDHAWDERRIVRFLHLGKDISVAPQKMCCRTIHSRQCKKESGRIELFSNSVQLIPEFRH